MLYMKPIGQMKVETPQITTVSAISFCDLNSSDGSVAYEPVQRAGSFKGPMACYFKDASI